MTFEEEWAKQGCIYDAECKEMAQRFWELALQSRLAGPSDEVILDAIVSSAMERGWSPSGSWAVAQGAIKRLAATTRPIEKDKP